VSEGPKLRVVASDDVPDRDWNGLVEGLAEFKADVLGLLVSPEPTILPFISPPLPTWDDLAAQRWGPAIGDPTPSIVIDQPDRERMMAALEAVLTDGPGEADESDLNPDLRTARGVSVYLNKGLEGGLFEKRKALGESLKGTAPALGMISEFQASETGRARIADADVKLSETVRGAENSRIDVVNRQALAKLIREKKIDTTDANVNDFLRGLIPFASIDSGKQQRISDEAASIIDMRAKEVGVDPVNRFVLTSEDRNRNINRTLDTIEGTGKNPLDLSGMERLLEQNNSLLKRFLTTVAPPVKGAPPAMPAGPARRL